jgi:HPt (histidine-containing phosphotransfer) domain-containing protein
MPVVTEPSSRALDTEELLARCLGKWELAHRVLSRFRNQLLHDLSLLQQAVTAGDAGVIAKVAHRIKGAAANVSARDLRERAAELEDVARASAWDQIPEGVQMLAAERVEFEAAWRQLSASGGLT